MTRKLKTTLILLIAAVFIGSSGLLVHQLNQYRVERESSAAAVELAKQPVPLAPLPPETPAPVEQPEVTEMPELPDPEPTPEPVRPLEEEALFLAEVNLGSLQAINPEVIGWISIPGTSVDYPLMHSEDNNRYLSFAWNGTYSRSGSIFMEHRNRPDFTDYNTIIYGHNMKSGSMFAALHEYRSAEFLQAHPNVYIADGTAVHRYEIYAAYEAPVEGDTYRLVFADEEEKQRFLDLGLELSVVETVLTPDTQDSFLTLSTCTGTGIYETRWVVQAVLTGSFDIGELLLPETAAEGNQA